MRQTVAEPAAVILACKLRFAVKHLNSTLVTGGGAGSAAVAFFLINLNYYSEQFLFLFICLLT